jgi:ATP-dependent Clp protease ATP-binding subunit ClpC
MGQFVSFVAALFIAGLLLGLFPPLRRFFFSQPAKAPVQPPAAPLAAPASPAAATLTETLQNISTELEALAQKTTHPRELTTFEPFKRAVLLLQDPAVGEDVVRQYIFGRLWTLQCAALEAVCARPDRQNFLVPVTAQLKTFSPGALHYALRMFASLHERPPVGDAAAIAEGWWTNHTMLTESFREYFNARDALDDEPEFGEALDKPDVSLDVVESFLEGVAHPFASVLCAELRRRKSVLIDANALQAFGRFWSSDEDAALVVPPGWSEALARAEAAILGSPPRSILVTGGVRVGKSTFLKLLGARLAKAGWRIFEANAAELMSGQFYFGQLEGRVTECVKQLDARKKAAWCVGDLQMLAGSGTHQGQSASILDQVTGAVATGRLVMLAEADPDGASRTLQARPSLRMHMEVVRLEAFDDEALAALAGQLSDRLEARHGVKITPDAREAAIQFGQQYLSASSAPGVVADVLKRAALEAVTPNPDREQANLTITPKEIIGTVSRLTGLPEDILNDEEPLELSAIRGFFSDRVIGQEEAVATVVDRIAMLKAGLVEPTKPIGVFLFAGPTGTGKTELAKTLADFLFGSPDRLVRLDMSEFQIPDSVAKIVGERGAGRGGDPLVERIRKQPFSVVLLDEFEKAHSNIWDLFLQVFDDGRLTDANGHTVDFRHTIIILTSNLGAAVSRSGGLGFGRTRDQFTEHSVHAAIQQAFRPEFINRLDRIVVFKPLSRELMYRILRKELADVLHRRGLRNRDWAVEWEPSALDFLLDRGFSPELGARPLKRAIDQYLLAPLAATLVERRFPEGDQFLFVRSDGRALQVEFLDPDAPDAEPLDQAAAAIPPAELALQSLILRPDGGAEVAAFLRRRREALHERLSSPQWSALKAARAAEAASPEIWARPDRGAVFAGLILMDRVREAANTVDGLARRLEAGAGYGEGGSRDLIRRLALQIHLVEAGLADVFEDAPVDAVLAVDGALDGKDAAGEGETQEQWLARIADMYAAWAERRRMQFKRVETAGGQPPLLLVSGFGAYRTLRAEAGLHILENPESDGRRRDVARVRVSAGPDEELEGPVLANHLIKLIDRAEKKRSVVRRYRERPSPLVRDSASGLRSGNMGLVLGGDFDLVFPPPGL